MKNNLNNKENEWFEDKKDINKMSDADVAKKFDKQMQKLENIAKKEAEEKVRENNDNPDDLLDQIDDFFDKSKEEFDEVNTFKEKRMRKKYTRIIDRSIDIQEAIVKSWESVLDEIKDWKEQKHPVAKSLFRIANWILKSEK